MVRLTRGDNGFMLVLLLVADCMNHADHKIGLLGMFDLGSDNRLDSLWVNFAFLASVLSLGGLLSCFSNNVLFSHSLLANLGGLRNRSSESHGSVV